MLTPFDDYPIHQSSEPIAHTVSGDRNHYDRYFFNGYDRDGGCFFAAALGVYPNRQVIGSRDRSWGVRGVGEPPGGAPARAPRQFFWLWAPLNFDDCCTHLALNEDAEGRHIYQSACIVPLLAEGEPPFGSVEATEHM